MDKYTNLSGKSGVVFFSICANAIIVKFKGESEKYFYTYKKPGKIHVERMKELAVAGKGLSSYISRFVGKNYELRE